MIVLDASVVEELLTNGPLAHSLRQEMARSGDAFVVPHLLDLEVVNTIWNLVAGQRIDSHWSEQVWTGLAALLCNAAGTDSDRLQDRIPDLVADTTMLRTHGVGPDEQCRLNVRSRLEQAFSQRKQWSPIPREESWQRNTLRSATAATMFPVPAYLWTRWSLPSCVVNHQRGFQSRFPH